MNENRFTGHAALRFSTLLACALFVCLAPLAAARADTPQTQFLRFMHKKPMAQASQDDESRWVTMQRVVDYTDNVSDGRWVRAGSALGKGSDGDMGLLESGPNRTTCLILDTFGAPIQVNQGKLEAAMLVQGGVSFELYISETSGTCSSGVWQRVVEEHTLPDGSWGDGVLAQSEPFTATVTAVKLVVYGGSYHPYSDTMYLDEVRIFGIPAPQSNAIPGLPDLDPDCSDGHCVFAAESGADDAGASPNGSGGSCAYSLDANAIAFGRCATGELIRSGVRFRDVAIPQGSQIRYAALVFTSAGTYTETLDVQLRSELVNSAAPFNRFSTLDQRVGTTPLTDAVSWPIRSDWATGQVVTSTDVSTLVEAVVGQVGWVSNNELAFEAETSEEVDGESLAASVVRRAYSFDQQGLAGSPRLVVEVDTGPLKIEIQDSLGAPVHELEINADGWPTLNAETQAKANPILVEAEFLCADDHDGPCVDFPVALHISSTDERGRFFVLPQTAARVGLGKLEPCFEYADPSRHDAIYPLCNHNGQPPTLDPGERASLELAVWVQPSMATSLSFEVTWGPAHATQTLTVPQSAITPLVFLPGLGATFPSINPSLIVSPGSWLDPLVTSRVDEILTPGYAGAGYGQFTKTLERLGYERDRTYFLFPYDWLRSTIYTSRLLREKVLIPGAAKARGVPWVAWQGNTMAFDLVGHSTGNLVARSYIQGPEWSDDYPIRRWVSISGPLRGLPMGYTVLEGVDIQLPNIKYLGVWSTAEEIWGGIIMNPLLWAREGEIRTRASASGFNKPGYPPTEQELYDFLHTPTASDPVDIAAEFLPDYDYLVYQDGTPYPDRILNPLLEEASALSNTRLAPYPGSSTAYRGFNSSTGLALLFARLGRNLCVIGAGEEATQPVLSTQRFSPNDTQLKLIVSPFVGGTRWRTGEPIGSIYDDGDQFIPTVSLAPGIFDSLEYTDFVDVDDLLRKSGRKVTSHTDLVGYGLTHQAVGDCLIGGDMGFLTQTPWNPSGVTDKYAPPTGRAPVTVAVSDSAAGATPTSFEQDEALPRNVFVVSTIGDVNLLLTDASGAQVGIDPVTGTEVAGLPGGNYAKDEDGRRSYIWIWNAEPEAFTIAVSGDPNTPYTLGASHTDDTAVANLILTQGEIPADGAAATVSVTVPTAASAVPAPPKIEATASEMTVDPGQPITFTVTLVDYNADDIHAYQWDFGDQSPVATEATSTHAYLASGIYTATLTVTDPAGFVVTDTVPITVRDGAPAHTTTFHVHSGATPGEGRPGYLVRVYSASGRLLKSGATGSGGDVSWTLPDGDYTFTVGKNGAQSQPVAFQVTGRAATISYALSTITVKAAEPDGTGRAGYLVRIFNGPDGSGSEWGNAATNSSGVAIFDLVDGVYGYRVDKNGATGTPTGFVVAAPAPAADNQQLTYLLAAITVRVVDSQATPHAGYLVRIFNGENGAGAEWGNASTGANGETTFYLVDDSYGFRVDKNGAQGTISGFQVASPTTVADHQTLTYTLATVRIHVTDASGAGHSGYLVRIFNGIDGAGSEWGNSSTNAGGDATFYLVSGDYGYRVERNGARGVHVGFYVLPPTPVAHDQTLTYLLASVSIQVQDSAGIGRSGYLVRMFTGADGAGPEWGNATTGTDGKATFYLVDSDYGYRIEKNGAVGSMYGLFVVPPAPTAADDQSLTYRLATVTIRTADSGGNARAGYLVRVFNGADGSGSAWGNASTNSAGEAVFELIDGLYGYRVEKNGAVGRLVGFGVFAPRPDPHDQTLTEVLATVKVHVAEPGGTGRAGYLVRVFNGENGAGTEWGNASTNASGDATFYLVEGAFGFRVDKNGATSLKTGFTVETPGHDQALTYALAPVTVRVTDPSGTGRAGYLARVFNGTDGAGTEWGNASTNSNGDATFYLVEGVYGYRVDKNGATSDKRGFEVVTGGEPRMLNYMLAAITVRVTDNQDVGRAGYLVRVFNGENGSGTEWGNATTNASGQATFYLIEGTYGYRVDKNGATSLKTGFVVAAGGESQTLVHRLAMVTVHVVDAQNAPRIGYLVRIFNGNGGGGTEWGNATTGANGNATFYLLSGDYGYRVDKNGVLAAKVAFTVQPPGPAGDDQVLTFTAASSSQDRAVASTCRAKAMVWASRLMASSQVSRIWA